MRARFHARTVGLFIPGLTASSGRAAYGGNPAQCMQAMYENVRYVRFSCERGPGAYSVTIWIGTARQSG
jgi:hypothetical protein